MSNEIYDRETGMLSITSDVMEAEFMVATQEALDKNEVEFEFYGYTVETETAMDVVQAMRELRVYH